MVQNVMARLLAFAGVLVFLSACSLASGSDLSAALSRVAAPSGLVATAADGQVTVSWQSVSGASSYDLYWSTSSDLSMSNGTQVASVTSPRVVTGLANGTTYYFRVAALSSSGYAAASATVSATPAAAVTVPGAPSVSASAGNAKATLTWAAVSGATGYNLYWAAGSSVTTGTGTKVAGVSSGVVLSSLANETVHAVIVTAVNAIGESQPSAVVTFTPTAAVASAVQFGTNQDVDFATVSTAPSTGVLVSVWTKITGTDTPDPAKEFYNTDATPLWHHSNMDVLAVYGTNWHVRFLTGNASAEQLNSTIKVRYNANSEFLTDAPGDLNHYFDDFSYFESDYGTYYDSTDTSQTKPLGPFTEDQAKGWVWAAWQIINDTANQKFIIRQWLKVGTSGSVFHATATNRRSEASWDTLRSLNGLDSNWVPSVPAKVLVGGTPSWVTKVRVDSRTTEPTLAELEALAQETEPASSSWAHWPLQWKAGAPDLSDTSGNNRSLVPNTGAVFSEGPAGPF